jgi:DNA replication initiation complex subunit (GINS family)
LLDFQEKGLRGIFKIKMITYQTIYDLLRKEKYSEELQTLPKNFFKEVAEYIKDKKQIISREGDMFSEAIAKTKKQLDNTISLIKELMLRRKKKILNLAFLAAETGISKKDFENMLPREKELFEVVTREIERATKNMNNLLNGYVEKELKNKLVRFKADVQNFMDTEGNILGPFKKGDLANLPSEIAKILIQDDKAEVVENYVDKT